MSPDPLDLHHLGRERVIGLVPGARCRLFWIHNPAQYLRKPRYLWPLARYRPTLIFFRCMRSAARSLAGCDS